MVIYDRADLMEKLMQATHDIKQALEVIDACKLYIREEMVSKEELNEQRE